jgi:sugar lactone lactonase YvrE
MTTSADSPFLCALDARASLGECPLWSVREQALYWIDINAPSLNRFDPATGANVSMPMPASIGCFAFRNGNGFVLALRDGVWLAGRDGTLERRVAAAPYDPAHHRFNDGRCDAAGRFFVGTMNEKDDAPSAALWRLDADFALTRIFGDMTISNGLAWSPDGRTMYHADTPQQRVDAFAFDARSGVPSNRRTFAQWRASGDRPDGGTVDSEGCYWSALYGAGRVVRIAPDGRIVAGYRLPAMCPTMCAFGGPRLSTLYVTTARQRRSDGELARYPQSGGVFAMEAPAPGMPECAFAA